MVQHVFGLLCVDAGLIAMLCNKRPGPHPKAGSANYWSLLVVFITATIVSILRWDENYHLFILGLLGFAAASSENSSSRLRIASQKASGVRLVLETDDESSSGEESHRSRTTTATMLGIVNAGRRFPDGSPNARRRQPWVLETGVAALPTVAKLIRGVDGIVQKSRILPHAVGWNGRAFQGPNCVRRSTGRVRPTVFYRSKF